MTYLEVRKHIADTFGIVQDFPFGEDEGAEVFRHEAGRKWFALMMQIPKSRLGFDDDSPVCVLNLKCDPMLMGSVRDGRMVFPAYHMNKEHWISVLLDENAEEERVKWLIGMSYELTLQKSKLKKKSED